MRVTKDGPTRDYPAFSPDGSKIAFRSDATEEEFTSFLFSAEVPSARARGRAPGYSPDGRSFVSSPLIDRSKSLLSEASRVTSARADGGDAGSVPLFLMPADGGVHRGSRNRVMMLIFARLVYRMASAALCGAGES